MQNTEITIRLSESMVDSKKGIITFLRDTEDIHLRVILFIIGLAGLDGVLNVNAVLAAASIFGDDVKDEDYANIEKSLSFWKNHGILNYEFTRQQAADAENCEIIAMDADIAISAENELTEVDTDISMKIDSFSIDKLSETLENDSDFRRLIHEGQIKFKCIFNPNELSVMYSLYADGIDYKLMLIIFDVLAAEGKRNLRYFEKVILGLAFEGIKTFEDYKNHYDNIKAAKDAEEKIRTLFSLGDKKYTAPERELIRKWTFDFKFPDDVLLAGAEICRKNIQKISLPYIHKIYLNWHEKGYKDMDDVKKDNFNGNGITVPSSFNIGKFFETAVSLTESSMKGNDYAL